MSIFKYASATVDGIWTPTKKSSIKQASDNIEVDTDIPDDFVFDPNKVYSSVRAISARVNDNEDGFDRDELLGAITDLQGNAHSPHNDKFGYRTFIGQNNHIDHANQPEVDHGDPDTNARHAPRGKILWSWFHEDDLTSPVDRKGTEDPVVKAAGSDAWVRLLIENDKREFPLLCDLIESGDINKVSMGCEILNSQCSVCGNVAHHQFQYCFTGDAKITMSDGTLKEIKDVKEGDYVLTHKGNSKKVVSLFERHYNGPMRRIYRQGYEEPLYVTHGHELMANTLDELVSPSYRMDGKKKSRLITSEENWSWTNSENVDEGSWLQFAYPHEEKDFKINTASISDGLEEREGRTKLVSHNSIKNSIPSKISSVNTDFAYVLGLYLAEGSFESQRSTVGNIPTTVTWTIHKDEIDILDSLQESLSSLGAGEVFVYPKKDNESVSVRLNNAALAALLEYFAGSNSHHKSLSGEIVLAPRSFQKVMLEGYEDGDGYSNPTNAVICRTVSDELAQQLVMIGSRCYEQVPCWKSQINSGGPSNREKTSSINVVTRHQTRMRGRRRIKNGFVANQVTHVEDDNYHGSVFNIEVEDDHSYVADGLVVHNCGHVRPEGRGQVFSALNDSPYAQMGIVEAGDPIVAFERNHGLQFFEESWILETQADPTAVLLDLVRGEPGMSFKEIEAAKKKISKVRSFEEKKKAAEEERVNLNINGVDSDQLKNSPYDSEKLDQEMEENPYEREMDYTIPPDQQDGVFYPAAPFPCSAWVAADQAAKEQDPEVEDLDTLIDVGMCAGCVYNRADEAGAVDCSFPEIAREGGKDPLGTGYAPIESYSNYFDNWEEQQDDEDEDEDRSSGFKADDGEEIEVLPGLGDPPDDREDKEASYPYIEVVPKYAEEMDKMQLEMFPQEAEQTQLFDDEKYDEGTWNAQHTVSITIPGNDSEGNKMSKDFFDETVNWVRKEMAQEFGGTSVTHREAGDFYEESTGEVISDTDLKVIESSTDDVEGAREYIEGLANYLQHYLGQWSIEYGVDGKKSYTSNVYKKDSVPVEKDENPEDLRRQIDELSERLKNLEG